MTSIFFSWETTTPATTATTPTTTTTTTTNRIRNLLIVIGSDMWWFLFELDKMGLQLISISESAWKRPPNNWKVGSELMYLGLS
jgi:hypothetical protein